MNTENRFSKIAQWLAITALMALFIVPFQMTYRVGPLSSFYTESLAMVMILVIVIMAAFLGTLRIKVPFVVWAIAAFALYLSTQAYFLALPWQSQVHLTVAILLVMALLAFAIRGLINDWGVEHILTLIAAAVVLGTILESAVMWIQFFRVESWFKGAVMRAGSISNIFGQLGQRNHLGHYMTWGVIGASYLLAMGKVPKWFGIVLVFWLGTSLGLVASRSITVYAILVGALALFALCFQWKNRRVLLVLFLAMVWVLLMQGLLSHVLDWFGWQFKGGLDRAVGGPAVDSSRQYEWKKAWMIFQSAPWFGKGFSSYSSEAFFLDGLPEFAGRGRTGVLYTHSHNMVLQLLAETGLVGTVLAMGSILFLLAKMVLQRQSIHHIFVAALLVVTLCHSMLEYPLWYVFFLAPMVIFLAFAEAKNTAVSVQSVPNDIENKTTPKVAYAFRPWLVAALGIVALGEVCRMAIAYNTMLGFSHRKNDSAEVRAKKTIYLKNFSEQEYLLSYYAQSMLMRYINPTTAEPVQEWEVNVAKDASTYRPFGSQVFKYALYQMRIGNQVEALKWGEYTWDYYPKYIPSYRRDIQKNASFAPMGDAALQACLRNQPRTPNLRCLANDTVEAKK